MNKDKFVEEYNRVNKQVEDEVGVSVPAILVQTGMTLTALVKARKHAKRGNYAAAVYYLLMWHSLKVSTDNAMTRHVIKKNARKDVFLR